jgi:hypothetical protein
MIALGISQEMMLGTQSFASANVGLQTQMSRYRAKRDLFEQRWIRDKFFKVMAQRNEWYRRDKRELVNQFRVKRNDQELAERLIIPKMVWRKKLMLRDDQSFLTFINQVYQNGKGPISPITLLTHMGLDVEEELKKKQKSKLLEKMYGATLHPLVGGAAGIGGGITAKVKNLFTSDKKGKESKLIKGKMERVEPIEAAEELPVENVDSHIERHRDFNFNGIKVKGCPIEYGPFINRYLNKMDKYFKKSFNTIQFVPDIIDLPEWEKEQRDIIEKESASIEDEKARSLITAGSIITLKAQKRAALPTYSKNKTLYMASWIGMEDVSITDNLIKYIDIYEDEALIKDVDKHFKKANYDLTEEEIQTYRVFNHIESLSNDSDNPRGYRMSEKAMKNSSEVDLKIINGKVWDMSGKCIYADDKEPFQVFRENLKTWIEYPHLLDKNLKESFKKIN